MSLSTGLSGVQAAQTDIDTIGNNIANVNTSGFKTSDAAFADLYGNALQNTPGQGTFTASLAQSFTQGAVAQTGNPLDVAINGNGFFTLQSSAGVVYSRDGAFQLDKNGNLVNDSGAQVMGFAPAASGGGVGGALQPIQVSTASIAPSATSELGIDINLPVTDAAIDASATPFSTTDTGSYDESTTTGVYDSLGASRSLTTYYTQVSGSGTPNQWQVNYALSSSTGAVIASGAGPTLTFNSSGQLISGGAGTITINNLPNGAAPLAIDLDFTGSGLSDLPFGVNALTNNGSGGGQFTGVEISADGQVTGQYSNGGTKVFGTIALANFADPQGLVSLSGNVWAASVASGPATPGAPATAGLGQLEAGSLEGSNADLSTQLVNLIVAQQAYQANVQGINVDQQDFQRLLTIQ
jgi:flagellar hook protein FlgE